MKSLFCLSFGILLLMLTYYLNHITSRLDGRGPNEYFAALMYIVSIVYIISGFVLSHKGK